jgi:hypothetical protein
MPASGACTFRAWIEARSTFGFGSLRFVTFGFGSLCFRKTRAASYRLCAHE